MRKEKVTENIIIKKTFDFALDIIKLAKNLEQERNFVISNQLLKSGTSIGANCWEAQNAESRADFIHKVKISAKEADETEYWLRLSQHAELANCDQLLIDLEIIQKILNRIIYSSKQKNN